MRRLLPLCAVLLAGCMVPPPDAGWEHPCSGRSSHAFGAHDGVWENVTAAGSGFRVHDVDGGVAVGPRVAALLGSEANVTSVRWRVDGGDVQDTYHESWENGVLTSPEVLTLRFWNGPELDGVLDGRRSHEDAAGVVQGFLDAVRGPQPDNADLAAAFVPTATADRGPRMTTDGSDLEPDRPFPHPMALPDGPWTVSSHLAAHADASKLRVDHEEVVVVDGAWQWRLEVPRAGNATYGPGAAWYLSVDALDRVLVRHDSNVTLDEAAFRQRLLEFLPEHGIHGADLDAWTLRPDDGYGDFCPPRPAPPPAPGPVLP